MAVHVGASEDLRELEIETRLATAVGEEVKPNLKAKEEVNERRQLGQRDNQHEC